MECRRDPGQGCNGRLRRQHPRLTLVFHHLAPDSKVRALAEIRRVLRPSGRLIIADYGRPRDRLQRVAFLYVQLLDGLETTRQHAAGGLPLLIANAGFNVQVIDRLRTSSGTIELLVAGPDSAHAGHEHQQ